jgi:hypothetical protein
MRLDCETLMPNKIDKFRVLYYAISVFASRLSEFRLTHRTLKFQRMFVNSAD